MPLVYEVGFLGSGREIRVDAGFVTDGASVPTLLRGFLPAWGRYSRAAVIHDFLIVRLCAGDPHSEGATRAAADAVFLEAMQVLEVSWLVRALMYGAVRIWAASRAVATLR